MSAKHLIINAPSMQSLWQKYSSAMITFVFWVLWFFLWIPVITAVAWYFGFEIMYFEMFEMSGYKAVIRSFIYFLIIVALLGGTLATWAGYNYYRFKGKDKRSTPTQISTAQQAEFLHMQESQLSLYQNSQLINVSFDESGKIISMQPYPANQPRSSATTRDTDNAQ